MALQDELGIRMKTFYEQIPKTKLMRRTPVALRIDGKAFHTFTKGFVRPFDEVLIKTMQETMEYLCKNVQGCVLGYTQSDEITLILIDYKKLTSDAWFDYEVQKMCSIAASMATMSFNRFFGRNVELWQAEMIAKQKAGEVAVEDTVLKKLSKAYMTAKEKGAMFDARCFNIPKEEVTNLIYWRQLDAARNSVQMVGQAHFSQRELQSKSCNEIQDMLMLQKGINWNDFPEHQKRGSCCIKVEEKGWVIDTEIPIFKGEGREYIEKLIYVGEE